MITLYLPAMPWPSSVPPGMAGVHECAVLRASGLTDRGMVALLFAEAAIPCLMGGLLGLRRGSGDWG